MDYCLSSYMTSCVTSISNVFKVTYLSLCALTNRCQLTWEIKEFSFNMGDSAFVNGYK